MSVRGLSSDVAARFVSLYYLGITAGRFVSGFLTLKLSNRTSIRAGLCLCGLGALLLLTPLGNLSAQTGLLLIGAGCAPVFPCLLHETPKRFGKARSQSLMGLQMACSYTSTTLIPPLFGLTAQWFGLSLFPFALLLLFLLAMFVCEWANRIFSFKGEAEGTPCSASDLTNPPEDL